MTSSSFFYYILKKMKNILIISLILFSNLSARSSHLMGGEIVVQNDQVGQYEILLTLYRDVTGILLNNNQTLNVYDSAGNQVTTIVSSLDSTVFHPVFGISNTSLLPNNLLWKKFIFILLFSLVLFR